MDSHWFTHTHWTCDEFVLPCVSDLLCGTNCMYCVHVKCVLMSHVYYVIYHWYVFEVVWGVFCTYNMYSFAFFVLNPCFGFLLANTSVNILYLL